MDKDAVINLIGEQVNARFSNLENKKVDLDIFWNINKILVGVIIAFASSIIGLYILYYSGIAELKTSTAVIETKISAIEQTLKQAEITETRR